MANTPEIMTTTGGNPVADNQNSLSAGPRGPLLMQDYQLIEKLAHQNRERIPERPGHAKGWGAHGMLTALQGHQHWNNAQAAAVVGRMMVSSTAAASRAS